MQELISELHQVLAPEEPLDGDVQLKYRNILKMLVYLMVQYIYEFEAEDGRSIRNDIGKVKSFSNFAVLMLSSRK